LPDSAILFFFRQSPRPLQHLGFFGGVNWSDPPV
jgi:hypothetical protein